jgi:putative transposase
MSHYRRADQTGGTFFFTVVTYRRQRFLCDDDVRVALRNAIRQVRVKRDFRIDAWVLLPDHLHCIWTLPEGDSDFSMRWSRIKRIVTQRCGARLLKRDWMTRSKKHHRESTLWQRRFWEHVIRDDEDYRAHVDYIHYNPVKHGLVRRMSDWPYSSFHRYVNEGVYAPDWGVRYANNFDVGEP